MPILGLLFSKMSFALAGTAIVGLLALGVTHHMEKSGALKERARIMDKITRENIALAKSLAKAMASLRGDYAKAQADADAADKRAAQAQARIAALPKAGAGEICPVDCQIPELRP